MTDNIMCIGCGAPLQNTNQKKIGYTPKEISEETICERCFKLKNYNQLVNYEIDKIDFEKIINIIKNTRDKHLFLIINVFNIQEIVDLLKLYNDCNYTIVLNKFDVLPKSVNRNKIINYIKDNFKVKNNVNFITTNSLKYNLIKDIYYYIDRDVYESNIFFIGYANAGKSTLLNNLLEFDRRRKNVITTSNIPGTTLNLIKFKLKRKQIIDTPGLFWDNSIITNITNEEFYEIFPKKELKQKVFQLNTDQSVIIGKLAVFSFTSESKNSFSMFFSPNLDLHRTKTESVERNVIKFDQDKKILTESRTFKHFNNWVKADIVIDNIGWISFYVNEGDVIKISALNVNNIKIRKSII